MMKYEEEPPKKALLNLQPLRKKIEKETAFLDHPAILESNAMCPYSLSWSPFQCVP